MVKKDVKKIANKVVKWLRSHSRRIQIAGSIRRGEPSPKDIDIVLIPKNKEKLHEFMKKKGKFVQGGESESTWRIEGVKVELYYTKSEEWGAMLMAFSGKRGSNIGLRVIAKEKGFKLTRHGLFSRKTKKRVAGRTERGIYRALGRPYKEPAER